MENRGWLSEHLEGFVVPYLGFVPSGVEMPFTPEEMTVIKNVWRSVKRLARGQQISLLGRDTFLFEILARRENYPTLFLPEVSRLTAGLFKFSPRGTHSLDTGFVGSVPKITGISHFSLLSADFGVRSHQVFPRLTRSRGLALKIEATPKYWRRAFVDPITGKVKQELSEKEEFQKAALLTMAVYRDSSPFFIPKRQPMGGKRGKG